MQNDEELIKEKGNRILDWMQTARGSLSNQTEQVLSARYSNVTPNDSMTDSTAQNCTYDAATPKVSIIQAFAEGALAHRTSTQSKKLTVSPIARYSVLSNTEVLENYSVSGGVAMQKSLRSTRKHIGEAMSSLHNASTMAEKSYDPNDTFDLSTGCESPQDMNESQSEFEIMSLDSQPQPDQAPKMEKSSNNFIEFVKSKDDEADETVDDVFEVSSNEESIEEIKEEDSESSEEGDSSESENEISDSKDAIEEASKTVAGPKFRLSQSDLEEGINPLDESMTEVDAEVKDGSVEVSARKENGEEQNRFVKEQEIPEPAQTDDREEVEDSPKEKIIWGQQEAIKLWKLQRKL